LGFHEVDFPLGINYGSSGGPGFKTEITGLDSGAEEAVSRWDNAKRRYNAAWNIKENDHLSDLITFFIARRGAANGFRYKDWSDYSTADDHRSEPSDTDQLIGHGDGTDLVFQLRKFYSNGAVNRTRNITKPVAGTTVVSIDGVPQPSGWSVNTTNGLLTFNSAPANLSEVRAGFKFMVPVRFDMQLDDLLAISIDDFTIGSVPDIPMVEITDGLTISDEFHFGGSDSSTWDPFTANTAITMNNGRLLVFNPSTAGRRVFLPPTTGLPGGGPYFFLKNISGSNAFNVYESDQTTLVVTVPADGLITILLDEETGTWYGF